ncbi:MAG: CotS family spore coat protein [Cellulosilyticaceae bacterium]
MKSLSQELIYQYDLNVKKYYYSRSNYYLVTPTGEYVLRKVNIPKEQIAFEYEVNAHLIENGLKNIDPIYLNKKKVPYAIYQDKIYVLQKYKEREEVNFQDVEDLKAVMGLLAKFHLAARGVTSETRSIEMAHMKNLYTYCEKRLYESKKIRRSLIDLSQKTPFEIMFLEGHGVYEELEELAIAQIDKQMCERLIQSAKAKQTIAHNDYSYHCIEKQMDGPYMLSNMDSCNYNVQLVDLANVLTKVMQKNNWDIHLLQQLIDIYIAENSLSDEEIRLLKAMMIFPEKYAGICQKYYGSRRRANYNIFEMKWKNMVVYQQDQLEVARQISKYL